MCCLLCLEINTSSLQGIWFWQESVRILSFRYAKLGIFKMSVSFNLFCWKVIRIGGHSCLQQFKTSPHSPAGVGLRLLRWSGRASWSRGADWSLGSAVQVT